LPFTFASPAEEAGYDTGPNREGQVVDGTLVAVILRQVVGLDQT